MLVVVPVMLLLLVCVCVGGLVVWLRSRRRCQCAGHEDDHNVTMLKIPVGTDPTYGVRNSPEHTPHT